MEISKMEQDIAFYPKDKNLHSNRIIDSKQEFTLLEKKIIYCVINQLEVTPNPQEDLFGDKRFKIPVSTFGDDYNFSALRQAVNKLATRTISGGNNKKEEAWVITPFPFAKIKNGALEVALYREAVPYFIDLKLRGYTAYQLDVALSLSSVYSQRLFELLSRFKDTGKWYVEISKLKFLLGIDKDKGYNGAAANGNLKLKVIEPAMKELAEKTDIEFNYSFQKEGRKYVSIQFDIYTKKLIKHIETVDAKADAVNVLEQVADASLGQQMVFLHTALADYQFDEKQKRKIIEVSKFTVKFVEVHSQILTGAIQVQTTQTRYMAGILRTLGWS